MRIFLPAAEKRRRRRMLNLYGIMRLASRINDLKKMGYDIKTEMIHGDNGKRYARYSLNHTQGELF